MVSIGLFLGLVTAAEPCGGGLGIGATYTRPKNKCGDAIYMDSRAGATGLKG